MALLLAAARHLPAARDAARAGRWRTWEPEGWLGLELRGARLVIVGAGRIGRAVAQRAQAFGMEVELLGRDGDLRAALARADVVSLHAPLTPETRHLIDARALALMRPGTILVNTARGGLVDQAALLDATQADGGDRRHRPRAAAARRRDRGCCACARRPAHRLGHPRSARADDRRRRRQPAGGPRRRAAPPPRRLDGDAHRGRRHRVELHAPAGRRRRRRRASTQLERRTNVTRLARRRRHHRPAVRRGDRARRPHARRLPQGDRRPACRGDDRRAHQRGSRRRQRRGVRHAACARSTASTRA